jgi:hypothetical protein
MTKREFVRLKEGDVILAIRHMLDKDGQILVAENSEWKVSEITLMRYKGQGKKPLKLAQIINLTTGKSFEIGKDNSTNFVLIKRWRGQA